MSKNIDFAKMLHDELNNFLDRIEDILNEHDIEVEEFIFIKFFITSMSDQQAMNHIIRRVLPWKEHIQGRRDSFFYKNKKIFGELPEDKVNYFSDLWMSKTLDKDDKKEIWEFFDVFIAFAEEYKKVV